VTILPRLVASLLLAFLLAWPAAAQTPGLQPAEGRTAALRDVAPATEVEARALLGTLTDQEVRDLLLQQLYRAAAAQQTDADARGPVTFLQDNVVGALKAMEFSVTGAPEAVRNFGRSVSNFVAPRGFGGTLGWLAWLGAAIAAGAGAYALALRAAGGWRDYIASAQPKTLGERIGVLIRRVLLDFGGIIAFAAVSLLVVNRLMPDTPRLNREVADAFISQVIMLPLQMAAVSRFLSAPRRPELRLLAIDDASAPAFHKWVVALAAVLGFQNFAVPFTLSHGIPIEAPNIGVATNLAFYIGLAWMCWRFRHQLERMMRGGGAEAEVTPGEAAFAHAYSRLAIGAVALNFFLIMMILGAGMYHLLQGRQNDVLFLVLMAPALDVMVRAMVRNLMPPMTGEGVIARQAYVQAKRAWIRIGRLIIAALVVVVVASTWKIGPFAPDGAGPGILGTAGVLRALIILTIGFLLVELASLWTNQRLAKEQTEAEIDPEQEDAGGEGGSGKAASRLTTVLPLLRITLQITVLSLTALIALSNLGLDVTPLLAGAGVLGLAIGFGAQKLVADVVSGVFFLIDDAFRVGEYLDVDGALGTVERISIRSLRLRHHRGAVHTIPFGEIPKVTNYSRDWVIVKLKFTVTFDTDPNVVKKIFKQIGKDLSAIPEFARDMLQPFKSQGVFDVDDVGIVVRGKFMTKPGKQFTIRKEVYQRVNTAFEEAGIQFARKEVVVRVAKPGDMSAAEAGGAAAIATEAEAASAG
jgi:small-conductance mechanosensitive channel